MLNIVIRSIKRRKYKLYKLAETIVTKSMMCPAISNAPGGMFIKCWYITVPYLVYVVLLCELVEEAVHAVEHGDDLHGGDAAADLGEVHHVAEQHGHALEVLRVETAQ